MPGIATIVSNLAPENKKIHLYYNTNDLNLSLQLKDGSKDGDDPSEKYAAASSDQKGFIVNPSDLGVTEFLGMKFVVGITQPPLASGKTTYTTYNVSIVSPVYCPLKSTELANTQIAVCSVDDKAWVYYLSGTDADSIELKEYALENSAAVSCSDTSTVLKGSHLAAYYNTDNKYRYVIYQHNSSGTYYLHEYCLDTSTDTKISNSSAAQKCTTIAVTFYDKQAYLYYTDSGSKILKLVKDSNLAWGGSSSVSAASDAVDSSSQLAVTTYVNGDNKNNHLFYIANGGDGITFTHVRDAL